MVNIIHFRLKIDIHDGSRNRRHTPEHVRFGFNRCGFCAATLGHDALHFPHNDFRADGVDQFRLPPQGFPALAEHRLPLVSGGLITVAPVKFCSDGQWLPKH